MLMAMEIHEIEAFVHAVSSGSFTGAAESLQVSQPAISRRLELLETELGAPLFQRTRAGARLTAAGEAFLPFALQILASVRDGASAVRDLERADEGSTSLALVGTLAGSDLTVRLKSFRRAYPGIRVALQTARSDDVSRLVQSGNVDLGLRYFEDAASGVICEHIYDERLVVAAAPQSLHAPSNEVESSALRGAVWITFPIGVSSSGEHFGRLLERELLRLGLVDSETIAIDSLTAQKRLIEADFGLGLMPLSGIVDELRLGTLTIVPIADIDVAAPVYLVRRRGGYLSSAALRLYACLLERE